MASILIVLPGPAEHSSHLLVGEYLSEKGHTVTTVPAELPLVVQSTAAQEFDYTLLYCRHHENVKTITTHISRRAGQNRCVLVLRPEALCLSQLMEYHGSGYLLENFRLSELVLCLSALSQGERYISQGVRDRLDEGSSSQARTCYELSVRESNILALLGQGKKSRQIAEELGISIYTLHNHKTNIRHKLQLTSNREILFMAIHQARGRKAPFV